MVGFSLGGVVAFEMARQLEAARQPIGLIALVDSQLCVDNRHLPLARRLRLHAWKLWHNDKGGRRQYLIARWRLLIARLRRHNISHEPDDLVLGLDCPPQVPQMAMVHLAALQRYRPGIYHGPVTLFTAGESGARSPGPPPIQRLAGQIGSRGASTFTRFRQPTRRCSLGHTSAPWPPRCCVARLVHLPPTVRSVASHASKRFHRTKALPPRLEKAHAESALSRRRRYP